MLCPTCNQEWANPDVYARLRAWRGTMTITDAAVVCRVGRITYGRIEAGIRTSWPEWWAVMSTAGIGQSEALIKWQSARPQTGRVSRAELEAYAKLSGPIEYAPRDMGQRIPTEAELPKDDVMKEVHGKVTHRTEPDGDRCGKHYEVMGDSLRFVGYCDLERDHYPVAPDGKSAHRFVQGVTG